MAERVAEFIRTHTPEEVNEYVMHVSKHGLRDNYIMDNQDLIAFSHREYRDTCLFSIFVTNTGVDTSNLSAVLTTLVRRVNKRRYFADSYVDDPNYNRHVSMRGNYEAILEAVREYGLADILSFGRYHTRETLDMVKNALVRLWFHQGLRGYNLTMDDINALRRCTQASAVYSFEPIDFLSLVVVENRLVIADEVRPALRELKGYTQRIQTANGVPDSTRLVIKERQSIRSECQYEDYRQIYRWFYAIQDVNIPEDMSIIPFIRLRPDLLAQLITSGLLVFDMLSDEDYQGIYDAWRNKIEDVHLISPKLLYIAGLNNMPDTINQAYLPCLTNDDFILEADYQITLMRDLLLPPELIERVMNEADSNYEPTLDLAQNAWDRLHAD